LLAVVASAFANFIAKALCVLTASQRHDEHETSDGGYDDRFEHFLSKPFYVFVDSANETP